MNETNETNEEFSDIIPDANNKGCLTTSLVLIFLIIFSAFAVGFELFRDNLPFIIIGLAAAVILPISGLIGIIQSIRQGNKAGDQEVKPSFGGHILALLIGLFLCGLVIHTISTFRWPG